MIPFNRSSCDVISGWLSEKTQLLHNYDSAGIDPNFCNLFYFIALLMAASCFFLSFFFLLLSFTVLALCFLPGIPCRYSKLFGGFVCQKTMIAFLIPAFYIRHPVHVGVTYRVFVKHINKQHKNVLWKLLCSAC